MALDPLKSWSIFLILAILAGCSERVDPSKVSPVSSQGEIPSSAALPSEENSKKWESLVSGIKDISVITRDGTEINLDPQEFAETFKSCPLVPQPKAELNPLFDYTVLIRTHDEQPAVLLQVATEGVKWENLFYVNEEALRLSQYIHQSVASRFFEQLKVDRMMLTSKDLDRIKRIPDEKLDPMLKMLRTAEFFPGKPRLEQPLFPYYILELDVGGKEIIQVDILSPTLISLKQSSHSVYYQTKDSMLPLLKGEIGSIDYSKQTPKYLFKAKNMSITDHQQTYVVDQQQVNGLERRSLIHSLVRELAASERAEKPAKKAAPDLKVEFLIGTEKVPVYLYEHSFEYQGTIFSREGILEEYKALVQSGLFVK